MCKAHVLRFSCNHGVLMSLEPCRHGPCPVLKTTGARLPQQPTRCFNCLNKVERTSVSSSSGSSQNSSCRSSQESLTSASTASTASTSPPRGFLSKCSIKSSHGSSKHRSSLPRSFSFSCHGSEHAATPHYTGLPEYLPHQDHACPPCQLEELRSRSDQEVVRVAKTEYPNLKAEFMVRDGRIWEEGQSKPTFEKYVDEKRTEDREMWLHVTRKWTQDLRKCRVLVAEEDGLGLLA